jgi:diguanylate cyclase (GGDEF)-like protein/PAS domain S-box-containing protein
MTTASGDGDAPEALAAMVRLGDRLATAGLSQLAIVEATAASIAELLDCAAVVFVERDGFLVPEGVHHRVPEGARLIRSIFDSVPHPLDDGLLGPVATSGQPLVVPVVPDEMLRTAYPRPEHAEYFDRFGVSSLVLSPMRTADGVLGVVAAAAEHGRAPFGDADVLVATDLCNRVAMALHNARLHEEAERARSRLHAIVEASADAVITIDSTGRVLTANAATEAVFGWCPRELVGRPIETLMPAPTASAHRSYLDRYLAGGLARVIGQRRVLEARHRDGRLFWAELSVAEITDSGTVAFTGFVRDVTERVERQAELARLAELDHLTGALNRLAMGRRLEEMMAAVDDQDGAVVVAFVDLDRFKAVNDRFGHAVGDKVLRIATDRIRAEDAVGRWGGDELVVAGARLGTTGTGADEVAATCERIRVAVNGPVRIDDLGEPVALAASVGCVSYPADGGNVDEIIAAADRDMFEAKARKA